MNATKKTQKTRHLLGLDLLRLTFVPPMLIMHVWNIFMGESTMTLTPEQSLYPWYQQVIGKVFGMSGPFLFALSFFLFGYLHKKNMFSGLRGFARTFILIGAMVSTQFRPNTAPTDPSYFVWDLFSFILLSFALITALGGLSDRRWFQVGAAATALLFVPPFWIQSVLENKFLPIVENSLISHYSDLGPNGWFILPWIGLPLASYAWGRFCKTAKPEWNQQILMTLGIAFVAVLALGWNTPVLPMKMTSYYYEFAFRQSPFVFWRYFLPLLALLYFFSRPNVNERLWYSPFRLLQYMQWNKNFWFAYALQFGMIDIFSEHRELFMQDLQRFDWTWLVAFLAVEVLLQMLFLAFNFYRWIGTQILTRVFKIKLAPTQPK